MTMKLFTGVYILALLGSTAASAAAMDTIVKCNGPLRLVSQLSTICFVRLRPKAGGV